MLNAMLFFKKNIPLLLTGLSVIAVFSYGAWANAPQPSSAAQAHKAEEAAPQTVEIILPTRPETAQTINFNARLAAQMEAALFARATGFVQERLADIGDTVVEGQLLAKLSAPELDAALKAQKAQLTLAQAELKLARNNLDRAQSLATTGAVSKASLDTAQADMNVKAAMVKSREADLAATRASIAFLEVKAPFQGMITQRNIEQGDKVSPDDDNPLFRLVNKDMMRVIVDVPQTQYFQVDKEAAGTLTTPEFGGQPFPVAFTRSARDVNQATGAVQVEYTFDNREAGLPSGLNVQISIPVRTDAARLIVPNSVLMNKSGQVFVFVVGDDNRLVETAIETGRSFSNEIEVISGLAADARLVINPNGLLKNGDLVTIAVKPAEEPPKP